MPDAPTYIKAVADRIAFWDGKVYDAQVGPLNATVGHLYDTLAIVRSERAYNLQLHFCVVLAELPSVDSAFAVEDFTGHAAAHGYATTKGTPGLGTIEVAVGALVAPLIHPDAARRAATLKVASRGAERRAVVVDLGTGWVHTCTGASTFHYTADTAVNMKVRRLFPLPAELGPPPADSPWADLADS